MKAPWIERFLVCWVFDKPKVSVVLKAGRYMGRGDYADEWGNCERCGKLAHRDTHVFGDGIWRHAA